MRGHRRSRSYEHIEKLKACEIKACDIKSKNVKANKAKVCDIKTNNLETEDIQIRGIDLSCLLREPSLVTTNSAFDCVDCDTITPNNPYGDPIKPDFLEQDVWDFLMCNVRNYQTQLQNDFLGGREQIRCIKEAYGCDICPPDCPVPVDCACPEPPNCSVPPECKPDPLTCPLEVPNYLYATQTVPPYYYSCGATGSSSNTPGLIPTPGARLNFVNSMNFNLNINNLTCTISPRVATVMLQIAYKGPKTPPAPTGPCPICPGQPDPGSLTCDCEQWNGPDINCNIVNIMCKQLAATINLNLGENFNGNIAINSDLINNIYQATRENVDGMIPAAIQMVIFLEDGLRVSVNGTRKSGGSDSNPNASQGSGFA